MSSSSDLVPIGVLSHLSGVPTDTIRTWERRYKLLVPGRDAKGRRVYSPEQLARLRLIASLSEQGERVADLAKLSDEALKQRARLHHENTELLLPEVIRVAVAHPSLGPELDGAVPGLTTRLEVIQIPHGGPVPEGTGKVDVVFAELSALGEDPLSLLRRIRMAMQPTTLLVNYRYIDRPMRQKLEAQPLRLLKGPIAANRIRELVVERLLADRVRKGQRSLPKERAQTRFTSAQLQHLQALNSSLDCECPNHVASLVSALLDFEVYSDGCANTGPRDAALHRKLSIGTSHARAAMEELLMLLVHEEGIQI